MVNEALLSDKLERFNQTQLIRFADRLSDKQRLELWKDIEQIDFELCGALIESHVKRKPAIEGYKRIEPANVLAAYHDVTNRKSFDDARQAGIEAIRQGKVAAFMVAGGQGTRLGYDGPKGEFRISIVRNAPLFQLFAEYLIRVGDRFGIRPPWFIMTSPTNHEQTILAFERACYFGLSAADVTFFQQGQMPAFDRAGKMLLASPHRVALSPNGHGGSLAALEASGSLRRMRERGIEYISYFQVDNPLVHAIDPLFIGLHIVSGSEMSSKAVTKADDLERVGNFCMVDGKLTVIEYSDLPESLAREKNADGTRRYNAGSIAIHVLNRSFVERLTADRLMSEMPWHRAEKKVATVDDVGRPVEPSSPNAVKLEMFVFDAIPLARNAMVMYTPREEEFSPVKNAEGVDSAATARRDLNRRAARWLEGCGVAVPRASDGEPAAEMEISPAFANDAEDLKSRLTNTPTIARGAKVLIE